MSTTTYTLSLPTNFETLSSDSFVTIYLCKNGENIKNKTMEVSELEQDLLSQFSQIFGVNIQDFEAR